MHINLWSVFKNVLLVTIVSNEIKCADRIVYETRIYKAVVVSARASECFFFLNIEEERLISWLVVTLQSRKGKILWFEYSTIKGVVQAKMVKIINFLFFALTVSILR